jgi:hypothetical protein
MTPRKKKCCTAGSCRFSTAAFFYIVFFVCVAESLCLGALHPPTHTCVPTSPPCQNRSEKRRANRATSIVFVAATDDTVDGGGGILRHNWFGQFKGYIDPKSTVRYGPPVEEDPP